MVTQLGKSLSNKKVLIKENTPLVSYQRRATPSANQKLLKVISQICLQLTNQGRRMIPLPASLKVQKLAS